VNYRRFKPSLLLFDIITHKTNLEGRNGVLLICVFLKALVRKGYRNGKFDKCGDSS
jgi:hypothetical protein